MARPLKQGIDYFPLDVNFSEDDKIEIIEADFGKDGFYVILKLFMRIYGVNGYYMMFTEREQKLFSKRINVDNNLVNGVIKLAITENLFNKTLYKEYGILTSKGIQSRYLEAVKRRKDLEIIDEYVLIDIPKHIKKVKITQNVVNANINSKKENINFKKAYKSTQTKLNKTKLNKIYKSIYLSKYIKHFKKDRQIDRFKNKTLQNIINQSEVIMFKENENLYQSILKAVEEIYKNDYDSIKNIKLKHIDLALEKYRRSSELNTIQKPQKYFQECLKSAIFESGLENLF